MIHSNLDNLFSNLQKMGIKLALDDNGGLLVRGQKSNLNPALINEIKASKAEIVKRLQQSNSAASKTAARAKQPPIVAVGKTEQPLSYAQKRLWLLDKIDGGSAHYHIAVALKISGRLDEQAFEQAFLQILQRHESLRTVFICADQTPERGAVQEPLQRVTSARRFTIHKEDLTQLTANQQSQIVNQQRIDAAVEPFDLATDLMLKVRLLKLEPQLHVVLLTMHHIASDGWSAGILVREFSQFYAAAVSGQTLELQPLPVQYSDYAYWQQQYLQGDELEKLMGYWERQLAGIGVVHNIPLDKVRPLQQRYEGAIYQSSIPLSLSQAIEQQCQSVGATLFMGLHVVFSALLSRYSNETDIVMGTVIANREQSEIAGLIGFFVNSLVLRSDLSGEPTFLDLLLQSKKTLLDAYEHQQMPFEQIVERLQPERSLSHSPLFQIMLVLQNNEAQQLQLPGLTLSVLDGQSDAQYQVTAKYDLTLNVIEQDDGLGLQWEYNVSLFEQQTIVRMAEHFTQLLTHMLDNPTTNIFALPMIADNEQQQLRDAGCQIVNRYPKLWCLHQLFEAQVAAHPHRTALVYQQHKLSYTQLNAQANQLAWYLTEHQGIKADDLVGICLHRSLNMLVSILAVLKAGGAYVPMDPSYPTARLDYIVSDAAVKMVITDSEVISCGCVNGVQTICLDEPSLQSKLAQCGVDDLPLSLTGVAPENMAYVIYTSGSTGQPKGVMVEHRNVSRLFAACDEHFDFDHHDVWTMFHSFSFDFTIWEIWGALLKGAKLVVVPYWVSRSPVDFYRLLSEEKVTVLSQTPGAFNGVIQQDQIQNLPLSLRYVVFGGEALNFEALRAWVDKHGDQQPALINMYGITETTVHVTYRQVFIADICAQQQASNIGKPLNDLSVLLLNQYHALVPDGVIGEMYVGGDGVTRGYLNRQQLTAERFVVLEQYGQQRFYRTGDQARRNHLGHLEYAGRIDHQVKIRGFRVELGEIETAILKNPAVNEAVVITQKMSTGAVQLVAYVVACDEISAAQQALFNSQLRDALGQLLPAHMLPDLFVLMEKLPLTVNGKVDVKALPEPVSSNEQHNYVAPQTDNEKLLAKIWQQTLKIERVGRLDNFFALGGHSLMVMQIITSLQRQGIVLNARDIFAAKTLADLAVIADQMIEQPICQYRVPENLIPENCQQLTPQMLPLIKLDEAQLNQIVTQVPGGAANIQDIYPLGPMQEGIYFHHLIHSEGDPYVIPALYRIADSGGVEDFVNALQFVIDRHDNLRTAIISNGLPNTVQVVCRQAKLQLNWLEQMPQQQARAKMAELMEPAIQSMDLTQAPLLQVKILPISDAGGYFVLVHYHHIISDHIGLEVIHKELAVYQAGDAQTLPPAVSYREFIGHTLHNRRNSSPEDFFRQYLAGVNEPTLPFGLLDTVGKVQHIQQRRLMVDAEVSRQLRIQARHAKISPAVIFHGVWALVVAATAGKDDVVFGTVVSGRLQGAQHVESMLGVLINTLPFRIHIGEQSLLELLVEIHQALESLLPYEQTPLAQAQSYSELDTNVPLFSSMLNYRHSVDADVDDIFSKDKQDNAPTLFEFISGQERTNYPFNLTVDDFGKDFALEVQIDDAIDADRIMDYVNNTLTLLVEALRRGGQNKAAEITVLPQQELEQQFDSWAGSDVSYPNHLTIHEVFEQHAQQHPERLAVIWQQQTLSYQQLNAQANQLARYLQQHQGVGVECMVGICMTRSTQLMVAIMAVLKAGGVYVPLDPDYPAERMDYMFKDTGLTVLLKDSHTTNKMDVYQVNQVCLDSSDIVSQLGQYSDANLEREEGATAKGSTLAYINYTSGSTGTPKGVMVEHHNVTSLVLNNNFVPLSADTVMLQAASLSFDAATVELWGPLLNGGTLVLYPQMSLDVQTLGDCINTHKVNSCWMSAGLFDLFGSLYTSPLDSLRYVMVGGDVVNPVRVADFYQRYPHITLYNGYGPTENTTFSAVFEIDKQHSPSASIPIGRSLLNRRCYVLNDKMRPVASGAVGQLYVGGEGLSRGYLNHSELTAAKFVDNPFYRADEVGSSKRLYCTGDKVRWKGEDGVLEYLGRADNQVKIRGFRIELGEIEAKLMQVDGIRLALVESYDSQTSGKQLVAYVVAETQCELAQNDQQQWFDHIKAQLAEQLPDYMQVSYFIQIEQLPLTANGKVDRRALPKPDLDNLTREFVAPVTQLQVSLCEIYKSLLSVERVGLKDNFFDLGGHSLLAMKLQAQIQQVFEIKLQIKDLLHNPVVGDMADKIESLSVLKQNEALKAAVDEEEEVEW